MNKIWMVAMLAIPLLGLSSDADVPAGFGHWSSASIAQIEQKLESGAATDPNHFAVERLADYPNETIMLVRRKADGQPEMHGTQVDVVFVQSGTATLLVGGTLENGETVAPDEKRNGTIEGGTRVKLTAGDIVRIPPRTPHQLLLEGSKEFDYYVVKVKGY